MRVIAAQALILALSQAETPAQCVFYANADDPSGKSEVIAIDSVQDPNTYLTLTRDPTGAITVRFLRDKSSMIYPDRIDIPPETPGVATQIAKVLLRFDTEPTGREREWLIPSGGFHQANLAGDGVPFAKSAQVANSLSLRLLKSDQDFKFDLLEARQYLQHWFSK